MFLFSKKKFVSVHRKLVFFGESSIFLFPFGPGNWYCYVREKRSINITHHFSSPFLLPPLFGVIFSIHSMGCGMLLWRERGKKGPLYFSHGRRLRGPE